MLQRFFGGRIGTCFFASRAHVHTQKQADHLQTSADVSAPGDAARYGPSCPLKGQARG